MNLLISGLLFSLAQLASAESKNQVAEDANWIRLGDQCAHFDSSVKSLGQFLQFAHDLSRLDADCIHKQELFGTEEADPWSRRPAASCLEAERSCRRQGIQLAAVKPLANLVERLQRGEPTCQLEFAAKIYRLHLRWVPSGSRSVAPAFARHLRSLANRWADRCRRSLARRLANVERRAPDARKHINLVVGMLDPRNEALVAEMSGLEPEQYVPVFEEELVEREAEGQLERGEGGADLGSLSGDFTFDSAPILNTALEMLRISCPTLQLYHVNLFGSLGLVASLGYGPPARPLDRDPDFESRDSRSMVRRWLASALICQLVRSVRRMTSVPLEPDDEGPRRQVTFGVMREADISGDIEEHDRTFGTFRLPEMVDGKLGVDLELTGSQALDLNVYSDSWRLQRRKLELISGPSRGLADAVFTYLDLRRGQDRLSMAKIVLGLEQ